MAVVHFAYTFDAYTLNQKLYEQIVEDGVVYPLRLLEIARNIMQQPSENLMQILINFRYSHYYPCEDANDQSDSYLWYLIYIANHFQETSSLSNNRSGKWGHFTLEKLLPMLGWNHNDVLSLILGNPIEDFLMATGYKIFADQLNLDGRCLSHADAVYLRETIIQTQSEFNIANVDLSKLFRVTETNKGNFGLLIEQAFFDAIEMLSSVDKHGDALFLFRD